MPEPKTTKTNPPEPPVVVVTLARGNWNMTCKSSANFPRVQAAELLLTNPGSTCEPDNITEAELVAAAAGAFDRLEASRAGIDPVVYLRRYPRRAQCYEKLAALLGVSS